ncbi:hypothetical protein BD779DRAFT_1660755 [Infundibulicybe gibba]|nr:hypothetical protein BD779DRAFT_1660755 [Infundibulicybe gibba]
MSNITKLPNGSEFILREAYSNAEISGVTVPQAILFSEPLWQLSAFNTRGSLDQHLFVRTHVAAYFVSLLICDLLQALGSILNLRWIQAIAIEYGDICVLQGVLKQTSDVGTAVWTLVIGLHTFCLLFLEMRLRRFALWGTLISGWSAIATIVIAGPGALDTDKRGPFFGISGYWCWISPEYGTERITLDYMIMFLAAVISFVFYILIFLRLRGNIIRYGWHVRLRRMGSEKNQYRGGLRLGDDQAIAIAKQMLLYPASGLPILILPIATARFTAWAGYSVPYEATFLGRGAVFLLSGVINVILFTTTRRILPVESMRIGKWSMSWPRPFSPSLSSEGRIDPYYETGTQWTEKAESETSVFRSPTFSSQGTAGEVAPQKYTAPVVRIPLEVVGSKRATRTTQRGSGRSMYSLYASYRDTNSRPPHAN